MAVQDRDGKWNSGAAGGGYNTRQEAQQAERNYKSTQQNEQVMSDAASAIFGVLLKVIFLILPMIIAKAIGFVIGILFHAGTVGRIILTVLVTVGLCAVLVNIGAAAGFIESQEKTLYAFNIIAINPLNFLKATGCLAISAFVGFFWFWRKHYFDAKSMPVSDFAELMKVCIAIFLYGTIILTLFLASVFKLKYGEIIGTTVPFAIAVLYYLLLTSENAKSVPEIKKSAERGDPSAILKIAEFYHVGGYGFAQDNVKAFECYEQAALKGYAEAQYKLGKLYMSPKRKFGIEQDYQKAHDWLLRAATNNSNEAIQTQADLLLKGELEKKMNKAGIAYNQDILKTHPIKDYDPADYPESIETPAKPVKLGNIFLAILFGLIGAIGFWGIIHLNTTNGFAVIIALLLGFILVYYMWRNRKIVLFLVVLGVSIFGWFATVYFDILPQIRAAAEAEQTVIEINEE